LAKKNSVKNEKRKDDQNNHGSNVMDQNGNVIEFNQKEPKFPFLLRRFLIVTAEGKTEGNRLVFHAGELFNAGLLAIPGKNTLLRRGNPTFNHGLLLF